MRQTSLGRDWRRRGELVDLGQDPLVSHLETALLGKSPISLQGRLGSNTIFLRAEKSVVRGAIVFDPNLVFCFVVDRSRLLAVLETASEEHLLRALYLMGQQAKMRSADLSEDEARKWLGM